MAHMTRTHLKVSAVHRSFQLPTFYPGDRAGDGHFGRCIGCPSVRDFYLEVHPLSDNYSNYSI